MKLIETILVDDDKMALEYIEELIDWEQAGFHIAGRALDGNQGYLLYQRVHPRLVIADVRMPVMTGIQLADKILHDNSETYILLLSNFDDFEYVRQAMRVGIRDYILKHELDAQTLMKKLKAVRQSLDMRYVQNQYAMTQLVRECFSSGTPTVQNLMERELLCQRYQYLLVQERLPFLELAYECGVQIAGMQERKVEHLILEGWRAQEAIKCVAAVDIGVTVVVLEQSRTISHNEQQNALHFQLQRLLNHMETESGSAFSVLTMQSPMNLLEAGLHYRQSAGALKSFYFDPSIRIAQLSRANPALPEPESGAKENDWIFLLCAFDMQSYPAFIHGAQSLLRRIQADPVTSPGDLKKACMNWRTAEDFIQWARPYSSVPVKYKWSQPVAQTMICIRENYQDPDLSVNRIAAYVSMSRSRLSALFSKEVGKGIMEYLNEYRLEQAIQLMEEDRYKVYEISEMVGYSSSQYFGKVFKKAKGVTPIEYRNKR